MALTLTTELDAVNLMLSTIGEAPINDLSASGLGDVAAAKTRLALTSRSIQTAGWHFNTEIDYELSPLWTASFYSQRPSCGWIPPRSSATTMW
jgi:hypothetical protein